MGRYLIGRQRMQRKAGRHPENRYMVMIMLEDEAGFPAGNIPPALLPDRYEQRSPHVTLYGPITLRQGCSPDDIVDCIGMHAKDRSSLCFEVRGLIVLRGRKGDALALEIRPDHNMKEFYALLSSRLKAIAQRSTRIDRHPELRRLHITLAFNMRAGEAERLCEEITIPSSGREMYAAPGITLIRNGALWCEYNLARHRWLDRVASFAKKER